ncbi:Mitochondrial amidoxime reducing component 2 [Bulinus truncatus]|nr:Mitochondrial amidoxime reducing component 2 [Bulinus truncatus]
MVNWSSLSDHWLVVAGITATTAAVLTSALLLYKGKKREFVYVGRVSGLHGYPIKSCKGIATDEAVCTSEGLQLSGVIDRHFLIIRSDGDFITQRQIIKMAGVKTSVENLELILEATDMPRIKISTNPELDEDKLVPCRIWDSQLQALDCGPEAGQWLSQYLKEDGLKLVCLVPGLELRAARCVKAEQKDKVAFPDRAPYLIATEESLQDLNARMGPSQDGPITMNNFRPTIIIKGCEKAWDEDNWTHLRIGQQVYLRILEPCGRCLLTTVDPEKMEKRLDGEPLKTLRGFRMFPEVHATAPLFGTYAALDASGPVQVGDPVYAVKGAPKETKPPGSPNP